MVKIVVTGGSSELAREVVDALVATNKHDITVFYRKVPVSDNDSEATGVTRRAVDYQNEEDLVNALRGVHTVLSFVANVPVAEGEKNPQMRLIDACIAAGVKRFAPSEYGSYKKDDIPFWAGKIKVEAYLQEVNKNEEILEYTLFQPGLFMDYLATPHKTAKYVTPLDTFFDFQNRRAILVEGHEDAIMTYTTVNDIAHVVARAVDSDRKWPVIGGISGNRVTVSRVLEIGEKIRGPFTVETVKLEDLQAGRLQTSWALDRKHPSYSDADSKLLAAVLIGTLLGCAKGAWDVSDAYNRLLPDYKFTDIEEFLAGVWSGKP